MKLKRLLFKIWKKIDDKEENKLKVYINTFLNKIYY